MAQNGKAKYVFYFIGDGMGVNQVNGTETYLAAMEGRIGTSPLCFAQFPHVGLVTTFSGTNGVTDSAAGGTALATGHKTKNGTIGMETDLSTKVKSIAEKAKAEGKAVGIATSVSVDHATPASFYAHVKDRGMYYQIGKDLIAADFDFYAGSDFLQPKGENGEKDLYTQCQEAGYAIARGHADYRKKARKAEKMLLLQPEAASKQDNTAIPYAIDRGSNDLTLQDITRAAIHFLSQKENGFFLMVEGGKIDWACHSNDAATLFREVIDMDEAVQVAYEFYEQHPDETLIIITADHETGGLGMGIKESSYKQHMDYVQHVTASKNAFWSEFCKSINNDPLNLTWENAEKFLADRMGLGSVIPLTTGEKGALMTVFQTSVIDKSASKQHTLYADFDAFTTAVYKLLSTKIGIGWTTYSHTGNPVPLFIIGAGADRFASAGWLDNTDLSRIIGELCNLK